MQSGDSFNHIKFAEIGQNPYILDLYSGMIQFLPGSRWWISDETGVREPISMDGLSVYCEHAVVEEKQDRLCREFFQSLESKIDISEGYIISCCDGFLQGVAGCWYRNRLIGGIGICHVQEKQRILLEQVLRIIQGYLSLLAGALEDHDDLELVHTVWSDTITIIDLNDLLPRLMIEICTAIGLPSGAIVLINEDGEFYPAYVGGYPHQIVKRRTLQVSRYEYADYLKPEWEAAYSLPIGDPLRDWLESELRVFEYPLDEEKRACLVVPFYRNQELVGLFLSVSDPIRPFSETKLNLVRLLATSGAAALDNALTVQRMEMRRKALATIHVIHRLICSSITTKDLLPRIGQLTRQLLKVPKCSIMLMDSDAHRLIPSVSLGLLPDEVGQQPYELGEGLPGWVAENMNPILYHPSETPPPWVSVGETYPSDSYLSVALFDNDVEGVITIAGKEGDFTPGDREILTTFAEQAIIAIKNARMHEGERTITVNALSSIANLIETRDPERPGVTVHTCFWSQRIAQVLNLSNREYQNITYAALLNDIGLLRTFDVEISDEELRMKAPQTGLRFAHSLALPEEVGHMVYHVNEAWNGQGYPDGLKGSEIPLGSRIIAVAKAYATLLSRWRGEGKRDSEKALNVIKKLVQRSYDPDIVDALQRAIETAVDPPEN